MLQNYQLSCPFRHIKPLHILQAGVLPSVCTFNNLHGVLQVGFANLIKLK